MLTYHGGTVYGKSVNNPNVLADTLLGIMVNCLHGGPTFISKMIPVSKLDTNFLKSQVYKNTRAVTNAGGEVIAIISVGNRTNQPLFKKYETQEGKPWLRVDGTYLLYDFVHLLKTFRNLWLTERAGDLQFVVDNVTYVARWQHLRELYRYEREQSSLVKMSMLTGVAVYPKFIERQRVQPCLNVFCDKTAVALQLVSEKIQTDVRGTVLLLQTVTKWWKIINVKRKGLDERLREPDLRLE